jgi:hypothetical protein
MPKMPAFAEDDSQIPGADRECACAGPIAGPGLAA